ncbi:MAG TPA: NADP-dependent oxidoreductase [Acidimicrobiales bacterium]|nr:NADP-dependent oxidoreductase [Acidimicrobiales bacterium]
MRAAAIDRFGGVDTLHVETLPVPEIGPDEVLIRVESAGVGVWDPYEREGGFAKAMGTAAQFPYILGSEGAGTVAAVGSGVRDLKEGDRVYATAFATSKGFYAEYAVANAEHVSRVPSRLSTDQAGVLPVDAVTALRGLDLLEVRPGTSVLIFGASGGVGHLAVQLAKRMGARVLAAASGDDGVRLARELGADAVVDGHEEDVAAAAREFAPGGLDAALLAAGGQAAEKAADAVRDGGRVAYPNGVDSEPKGRPGVTVQSYNGDPDREAIERLNRLIEAGPFEVHVARTFPLDQAADAHRALKQHYVGKLALRLSA